MTKSERGFLFIADITGYTAYLNASELEHAEDSLRSLLDLLIAHTRLPQVISRLEGDAVISYALEGSFLQEQTLVELVENTYLAFRQGLALMVLNTTCDCNACRNLGNLDLKIFVHYGTFMLQKLSTYTELIGNDVNLIHRLTKNTVFDRTGLRAYIQYTEAAARHLGIDPELSGLLRHPEQDPHVGEVGTYVQDMHVLWEQERDRVRITVQPEDAAIIVEARYSIPVGLMWDYVTLPEYKAILTNSTSAVVENRKNGRIGEGSDYLCAHGRSTTKYAIVDWQPAQEYTNVGEPLLGCVVYITTRLMAAGESTQVQVLFSEFHGGLAPVRFALKHLLGPLVRSGATTAFEKLRTRIEAEREQGRVVPTAVSVLEDEDIEKAVQASLNRK